MDGIHRPSYSLFLSVELSGAYLSRKSRLASHQPAIGLGEAVPETMTGSTSEAPQMERKADPITSRRHFPMLHTQHLCLGSISSKTD
jgi:hypothetical protein